MKHRIEMFPEGTPVRRYLEWVDSFVSETNCSEVVEEKTPFLSIITRTQGKRPQELQEVFLCLAAQSDMDYEVILIGHKISKEQEAQIRTLIEDQPVELRDRIRFYCVDYGTRTTPLNFGFEHARGEYAAILDDDDIVFDNWVEAFHNLAKEQGSSILHSYCFSQDWQRTEDGLNGGFLRSIREPKPQYCQDFYLSKQLYQNECPLMVMAFPLYAFRQFGMKFDEKLTTTEDWDYIMRVSFVCGVQDTKEATSIYRHWKNAENSATIHSQEEWKNNYDYIQKKFLELPIVLPTEDLPKIYETMQCVAAYEWEKNKRNSEREKKLRIKEVSLIKQRTWDSHMYVNEGSGYSEEKAFPLNGVYQPETDKYIFDGKMQSSNIRELRWDPAEMSGIMLSECEISVMYHDGSEKRYNSDYLVNNGYSWKNKIMFPFEDPWIIIPINSEKIVERITINTTISESIPREDFEKILPKQKVLGVLRKLKRKLN